MAREKYCTHCGKPLGEGARVCTHCGKVVPMPTRPVYPPPYQGGYEPERRNKRPKPRRQASPPPVQPYPMPTPERTAKRPRAKKRRGKISARIYSTLTVLVILAALYAGIFIVEVTRVRVSTCKFDSELKMSARNYGQAIDAYYKDGSWSVNPFTLTCKYKGQTRHKEQMELVFSAKGEVVLEEISVDGEVLNDKQKKSKLLGMFI